MSEQTEPSNREEPNPPEVGWLDRLLSSKIALPVGAILLVVVGAVAESYFGFVGHRYEVVRHQIEAVQESAASVEDLVAEIVADTRVADGQVEGEETERLRHALLELQRKARSLAYETGNLEIELIAYEAAMADLIVAASRTTDPLDARPLWDAVQDYYLAKNAFETRLIASQRGYL